MLVDNTPFIKNCAIDYNARPEKETLKQVLYSFISQCKNRLPDDEEITCGWLQKSGLSYAGDPQCGENQIWKGCARECEDTRTCEDFIYGNSVCPESEPTISMCVCKNGFYLLDGVCVSGDECKVGTGVFSDWTEWTDCSVTCGKGSRSKTRICLGPGSCKPDQDMVKEASCDAGMCGLYHKNNFFFNFFSKKYNS